MTFIGVLEAVGKGFEKGLQWAVAYAVPVERLVALLFPAAAPALIAVTDATTLIQTAVLQVEQKFGASGTQSGTGAQKLAEVVLLVGPVVTKLLGEAGITTTPAYLQTVVSAVVAILNAQTMPATAAPTATMG